MSTTLSACFYGVHPSTPPSYAPFLPDGRFGDGDSTLHRFHKRPRRKRSGDCRGHASPARSVTVPRLAVRMRIRVASSSFLIRLAIIGRGLRSANPHSMPSSPFRAQKDYLQALQTGTGRDQVPLCSWAVYRGRGHELVSLSIIVSASFCLNAIVQGAAARAVLCSALQCRALQCRPPRAELFVQCLACDLRGGRRGSARLATAGCFPFLLAERALTCTVLHRKITNGYFCVRPRGIVWSRSRETRARCVCALGLFGPWTRTLHHRCYLRCRGGEGQGGGV